MTGKKQQKKPNAATAKQRRRTKDRKLQRRRRRMRQLVPGINRKSMQSLACVIAEPAGYEPTRLPDFPNVESTAVCAFQTNATIGVNQALTVGGDVVSVLQGFTCHSPIYPVWTNGVSFRSSGTVYAVVSGGSDTVQVSSYADTIFPEKLSYIAGSGGGIDLLTSQRWPVMTVQENAVPRSFIYTMNDASALQAGSTRTYVTINWTTTVQGSLVLRLQTTNGRAFEHLIVTVSQATPSNQWTVFLAPNKYMPFMRVHSMNDANLNVQATINTVMIGTSFQADGAKPLTGYMLPLYGPPEFPTINVPYRATRMTAGSLLLTNVTKNLSKEGTVIAGRVATAVFEDKQYSPYTMTPENLQALIAPLDPKNRYAGALSRGFYTFTTPDQSTSEFRDYVDSTLCIPDPNEPTIKAAAPYPLFFFEGFNYVNMFLCTDLDSTDKTNLLVTGIRHLEYRTTSTLFHRETCKMPMEQYHAAQLTLAELTPFYENPLHIGDIARLALRAASFVAPHLAPYIRPIVTNLGERLINYAENRMRRH